MIFKTAPWAKEKYYIRLENVQGVIFWDTNNYEIHSLGKNSMLVPTQIGDLVIEALEKKRLAES